MNRTTTTFVWTSIIISPRCDVIHTFPLFIYCACNYNLFSLFYFSSFFVFEKIHLLVCLFVCLSVCICMNRIELQICFHIIWQNKGLMSIKFNLCKLFVSCFYCFLCLKSFSWYHNIVMCKVIYFVTQGKIINRNVFYVSIVWFVLKHTSVFFPLISRHILRY